MGRSADAIEGRTPRKGWRARLLIILLALSPFLILEITLRVIGYGRDPFKNFTPDVKVFRVEDRRVVVSDDYRPMFQTRPFLPQKPVGTTRIFAVGDSVTYGWTCTRPGQDFVDIIEFPYPALLEESLQRRFPERSIEVLNCGGLGHSSFRLQGVVREVLEYSPDLIVLMTGNSEFLEARAYKNWQAIEDKGLGFLRGWRTLTLLRNLLPGSEQAEDRSPDLHDEQPVHNWGTGIEDGIRSDETRAALNAHSSHNLEVIADACRDAGVPLILCTVPCDLRIPPHYRSLVAEDEYRIVPGQEGDLTRARFRADVERESRGDDGKFMRTISRAVELAAESSFEESLDLLDVAQNECKDDPRIALLHYCRGRALDGLRRFPEARMAYEVARDLDLLPFRTQGPFNDVVRTMAERPGAHLAEVEMAFAGAVPDGIPDRRLLFDQCHPTIEGHRIITRTLMEVILAEGVLD